MKTAESPAQKTYSNPRLTATIANWPIGSYRTTATFCITQHPTRGERAERRTADPLTGRLSKPTLLPYASLTRIVDGSDGRIYIIRKPKWMRLISIMQSNMQFDEELVYPDDARYAAINALFGQTG